MTTIKQVTQQDLNEASLNTLLNDFNLSLKEVFELTDRKVVDTYPEVVAEYYTMQSLLKVANRFGDVEEANFFATKLLEMDNDWFDLTQGCMPIDRTEITDPEVFEEALAILERV